MRFGGCLGALVALALISGPRGTAHADASAPDGGARDAGPRDAGAADAPATDAASPPPDAAPPDAAPAPRPGHTRLEVELVDAVTERPIEGAVLVLSGRHASEEAVSDDAGRARFDVPFGRYILFADPSAHQPARRSLVLETALARVRLPLAARTAREDVIAVTERLDPPTPLQREVARDQLRYAPGSGGDPLRVIQSLPGVARVPFGGGALLLRGTSPRDSRALVDGLEVPQLFHFGALVATFQPAFIERVDLWPGGFDAQNGRALGGLVAVTTRAPRKDRLSGAVDVSLIDATALAEGPLGEGAFAIGIRRSYVDAFLSAVLPSGRDFDLVVAPRYYDYQARYERALDHGVLTLTAFGSDDRLEFLRQQPIGSDDLFDGRFLNQTLFHRLSARHLWRGRSGALTSLLAVGFDHLELELGQVTTLERRVPITWREDYAWAIGDRLEIQAGTDVVVGPWWFESRRPPALRPGELYDPTMPVEVVPATGDALSLYAGASLRVRARVTDWLEVRPGLRLDWLHRSGELVFDPRLAVREQLSDRVALRQYLGIYHQPPADVELDRTFGNPRLEASAAIQSGLGASVLLHPGVSLELDTFYDELLDLPVPSQQTPGGSAGTGKNRAGGLEAGTAVFTPVVGLQGYQQGSGVGRAVGGELLLRAESSRGFGWIAYTLSEAVRQADAYAPAMPFSFDQTHILTVLGSHELGRGFRLGARFRYVTGNPYTKVERAWLDADQLRYVPIAGPTNAERLSDFHALDVRLDKQWRFARWQLDAYLDVQNVYAHQSIEAIVSSYDFSQTAQLRGLPILPSLGVRGTF